MLYTWNLINKAYNLNSVIERIIFRDDLQREGFFKENGNMKYFTWFEDESIGKKKVIELMTEIKGFTMLKMRKGKNELN